MTTIAAIAADLAQRPLHGHAAVRVPATSANLGPGYDALGVALDVPMLVAAGPRTAERVTSLGAGEGELPTGDDNLVWRAVLAWCDHTGAAVPDVSLTVRSPIPLERGMGSSSAAAVAGLVLARELVGGDGGTSAVLGLATELEGHPDNAAAAILGGLVLCLPDGQVRRATPDGGLRPVLLVPATRQSTDEARAALPAAVPLAEAAANGARVAATFAGLSGLVPLDPATMTDVLHEPTRLGLMPVSGALVAGLRAAGVPAALSGAGPAVLAVVPARDADAVAGVRAIADDVAAGLAVEVEVVASAWDLSGARPVPLPDDAG